MYLLTTFLPAEQYPHLIKSLIPRSRARGGARVRARGRPRKGTAKVVDEKKVLRGMKRELGLREERVREFGFFEDAGREEEEVEVQGEEGDEADDQFSAAARARTRCGRLPRLPLRISTGENPAGGGNLDATVPEAPPTVAEVVPEVVETPALQSRRNFTPPAR